jgi:hypothetical protein
MSSPEVIRAVGEVLKAAAAQGAEDDYRRAQVLSAYSITRHLAAEESGRASLSAWFRAELETILGDRDGGSSLAAETDPAALGERLSRLLAELRAAGDEDSLRTAAALRAALRQLCDREVETLAAA